MNSFQEMTANGMLPLVSPLGATYVWDTQENAPVFNP